MTNVGYLYRYVWGCFFLICIPIFASAQDIIPEDYIVPEPKTITASIKPAAPKRVVDIHFFDEAKRRCVDTIKLESSRIHIHAGQPATFRTSIQRKCNDKSLPAPIPQSATFSVRAVGSKKTSPDSTENITPSSSSSSFSHTFSASGSYQVAVIHRMNEVESHTVSFTITVLPPKIDAPAPENTN